MIRILVIGALLLFGQHIFAQTSEKNGVKVSPATPLKLEKIPVIKAKVFERSTINKYRKKLAWCCGCYGGLIRESANQYDVLDPNPYAHGSPHKIYLFENHLKFIVQ